MKKLVILIALISVSKFILAQSTPHIEVYADFPNYITKTIAVLDKQDNLNKTEYSLDDNYYNYYSGSALTLGRGFSPYYIDKVKQSPFTFEFENTEGLGAYNTNFDVQIVFNKYQLEKSLDFDAKMDARIFSVKANAYLQTIEKTTFDESSLCIVIKASCEYGRTSLKNLVLKREAGKLAKSNTDKFKEIYGSKFPIMITRGSSVYFVMKISNVSKDLKDELKAGISASYNGLVVSGSIDVKLRKELHEETVNKNMTISILANGSGGLDKLSDIIKLLQSTPDTENSFMKIRDGLAEYFKSFDSKNAATTGYFCADYKDISSKLSSILPDFYTIDKEKCLGSIISLYRVKEKELEHLSLILNKTDPISYYLPKEDFKVKIPKYIAAIRFYQDTLRKFHLSLSEKSPKTTDFTSVKIPIMTDIPLWVDITVSASYDTTNTQKPLLIKGKYLQEIEVYFDNYPDNKIATILSTTDLVIGGTKLPNGITLNTDRTLATIARDYIKNKCENTLIANTTLGDIVNAKKSEGSEIIIVISTRYATNKAVKIGRLRTNGLTGSSRSFAMEFYENIE